MAFTEQNKADAYLFFVLAFNAAPGTVYGGQIVEAYESGMTTADIVAQYVEKPAFTSLYPTTQTANEFATALVNNVVSLNTTAAVKASAVADIETALAAGWTKAQVVTQILGNLANKSVADAQWGETVAQLNNKIAVAKALTEGPLALTSEDAAVLKGPLASVTHNQDTVQKAINGAGSASVKMEALNAAIKAKADFTATLTGNVTIDDKLATAVTNVEAALGNATGFSTIDTRKETVSTATQNAIVALAKQQKAEALATAKTALEAAKVTYLNANTGDTRGELDTYLSAKANQDAAVAAKGDATKGAVKAQNDAETALENALLNGAVTANVSIDAATGTASYALSTAQIGDPAVAVITVQGGVLAVDAAFAASANAAQLTAAQKLLTTVIANQKASADVTAANAAVTAVQGAVNVAGAADAVAKQTAVKEATDAVAKIDTTLKAYQDALATVSKDVALDKAIADANKAFTDAGQAAPVTIDATAVIGTAGANLFVLDGTKATSKTLTGFAADDQIYAGKNYTVSADITKGDDAKLEVFFKANGANTDVYIEQKAFGSNTAGAANGNGDFVKITLTGVAADKLVLKDGFVTVAA